MMSQPAVDRQGLHLKCHAEPVDSQWWDWAVWLEGAPAVLDRVRSVRYVLHPTFPNPVRTVTDRASKFRLESIGWGEFAIAASVAMEDGIEIPLERWLSLGERTQDAEAPALASRPRVFLSYSGLDRPLVAPLVERLRREGIEVTSPDSIEPAETVARSVGEAIQKADVVAVVTHGDLRGPAEEEVDFARDRGKPVVPILVGTSKLPEALAGFSAVRMNSPGDLDAVSDAVVARAKDAFYPEE